jgi:hypothetical protein
MRTLSLSTALLLLFVSAAELRPAPADGGPSMPSYRYLFLVDTSFSMRRQRQAVVSAMQEMVRGGFQWKVQPGETFGIWTFNEKVDTTSFTPQTWSSGGNEQMARLTANHMARQRFDKKPNWETAMNKVAEAIEHSDLLTLFILTDGQGPISGTPLDEALNALYKQHGRELQRLRRPFITTFMLVEGDILAWAVGAAGEPIEILDFDFADAEPEMVESPPEAAPSEPRPEASHSEGLAERADPAPFQPEAALPSLKAAELEEKLELEEPLPASTALRESEEMEEVIGHAQAEFDAHLRESPSVPMSLPPAPETPVIESMVQIPPAPGPAERLVLRPPKPSADLAPSGPPNRIAQLVTVKPAAPVPWSKPEVQSSQSPGAGLDSAPIPAPKELKSETAPVIAAAQQQETASSGVETIAVVQPGHSWFFRGAALFSLLIACAMAYSIMRSRTASKDASFISRSMKNQNFQDRD